MIRAWLPEVQLRRRNAGVAPQPYYLKRVGGNSLIQDSRFHPDVTNHCMDLRWTEMDWTGLAKMSEVNKPP